MLGRLFRLLALALFAVSASAQTIAVGQVEIVMTASQRAVAGLQYWPDGDVHGFELGGVTYLFASNGGYSQGVMSSGLDNLASNITLVGTTENILRGGPNDFDRNYAGGGPVYLDAATGILLQLYHGEYWYNPPAGLPFYSGIGLAYSTDHGLTWHKLGQVISPATARSGDCQVDVGGGTLVPVGDYFYLYYDDEAVGCDGSNFNLAVARALRSDVIAAAQAGTSLTTGAGTLFRKYDAGSFTENGVIDLANPQNGGGSFTALLTGNASWWPTVAYNSYINKYVLAYAAAWNGIGLRFSDDGISWSAESLIVSSGGAEPPNAIYYPSLLNTLPLAQPEILGQVFYLYFVQPFGNWTNSILKRVQISITSGSMPGTPDLNQHGLTGSWYNPITNGQGVEVEVFPNTSAGAGFTQVSWFTFDTVAGDATHQRWYTIGGAVMTGQPNAALTIYENTGGNFNALPVTNAVIVGTATLSFSTCISGQLTYAFNDGRMGNIPLTRLTQNMTCSTTAPYATNADFALSGNWYAAATSGQGFTVEVNPASTTLFAAWYTYAVEGSAAPGASGQRWYTAQGTFTPGSRSIPVQIYASTGGAFNAPAPPTTNALVGSGTLVFQSCMAATFSYTFTAGSSMGLSGTIDLTRVGPVPPGCTS